MSKIIGVTVGTTKPRANLGQTNPKKADYIMNRPTAKTEEMNQPVGIDENGNLWTTPTENPAAIEAAAQAIAAKEAALVAQAEAEQSAQNAAGSEASARQSVDEARNAQSAAESAKTAAEAAADRAENADETAEQSAEAAQVAQAAAEGARDTAMANAEAASTSATNAAGEAGRAVKAAADAATARTEADTAKSGAEAAKNEAEQAASNAASSASAASTSATNAGKSATAAAGSATTASDAASSAQTAAETATGAKTAAETAKSEAEALKNEVERKLANGDYDGADGKSAYQYARDGGFAGTEAEFAAKLAKDYDAMISDKADKTAFSLGIAPDGLIHVYVDGVPVGAGVPQGQGGDAYGYVDAENLIVLKGNLQEGATYTFAYVMPNGKEITIGTATLDSSRDYYVTNTLTKCSSDNPAVTITEGAIYSATLTANSGYSLGTVKVTMGGTDITSSAYSNGKITIASVTGDIEITATATASVTYHSINLNLTRSSSSNTVETIADGSSYSTTLTADVGYELNPGTFIFEEGTATTTTPISVNTVTVTMNGDDITSDVYNSSTGEITIQSVTGDVEITAHAQLNTNVRLSASADSLKSLNGGQVTGYIPIRMNQVLTIEGFNILKSTGSENAKIALYNSSKKKTGLLYGVTSTSNSDGYGAKVTTNGNVQSITMLITNKDEQRADSTLQYIRIEGSLMTGYTNDTVVFSVSTPSA